MDSPWSWIHHFKLTLNKPICFCCHQYVFPYTICMDFFYFSIDSSLSKIKCLIICTFAEEIITIYNTQNNQRCSCWGLLKCKLWTKKKNIIKQIHTLKKRIRLFGFISAHLKEEKINFPGELKSSDMSVFSQRYL